MIDAIIAYRILKILTTPWIKQKAFNLGIVDDKGRPLKQSNQLHTTEEREAYTLLHRLVFRIKRIIESTPLGSHQFVSYAAALALIKECVERDEEPISLETFFLEILKEDIDTTEVITLLNSNAMKNFSQFREDASAVAANNTSGIVGTGDDNQTVVMKKKSTILKRGIANEVSGKDKKLVPKT